MHHDVGTDVAADFRPSSRPAAIPQHSSLSRFALLARIVVVETIAVSSVRRSGIGGDVLPMPVVRCCKGLQYSGIFMCFDGIARAHCFAKIMNRGLGHRVGVVPLTHPEFGYAGASNFRRGFIALVICGLVAGSSGIAIFMGNPDPDPDPGPMKAMALAPAEILSSTAGSTLSGIARDNSGELTHETAAIKPRCQNNAIEHLGGDCIADQSRRPRSIRALNDRPAIAAVPIGHFEKPPDIPSGSAIAVAVTPESTADTAGPADAPPAVETAPAVTEAHAPAVSPKKKRTRSVRRRDRNDYSPSTRYTSRYYQPNYYQSGYARLW